MISRQHFDVEMPMDGPEASDSDPNFHRGKHQFSLTCVWPVLDVALASADRGTYSAILKLDKKIRDWKLPANMKLRHHVPPADQQTAYIFQRTGAPTLFPASSRRLTLQSSHFHCARDNTDVFTPVRIAPIRPSILASDRE
jgi:hypothetical protein